MIIKGVVKLTVENIRYNNYIEKCLNYLNYQRNSLRNSSHLFAVIDISLIIVL